MNNQQLIYLEYCKPVRHILRSGYNSLRPIKSVRVLTKKKKGDYYKPYQNPTIRGMAAYQK